MPGSKRSPESLDDGAVKRARTQHGGVAPVAPVVSEALHRDELGFELEDAAPVKLVNSGRRCESAWAAFEAKAADLGVDLEARSEDVRQFVRVKCVRPTPPPIRCPGIYEPSARQLGRARRGKRRSLPRVFLSAHDAFEDARAADTHPSPPDRSSPPAAWARVRALGCGWLGPARARRCCRPRFRTRTICAWRRRRRAARTPPRAA